MPRQLVFSRVPVELSILEFDLTAGEEIFLTYTWELENGPPIFRTGEGPPYMDVIGGSSPEQTTTHPFGLRLGTWLIQENMRKDELRSAEEILQRSRDSRVSLDVIDVLQRTVDELKSIKAHDKVFKNKYRDYDIIGQQGCGDLTMNFWNVAYVNNGLAKKAPALVGLPQEPLNLRSYSCLVKWKAAINRPSHLTIQEVEFRRWNEKTRANHMVWLRYDGKPLPRGDLIEFAVSNQQVIRDGRVVPVVTTCHQFADLRHLIQMPNINPPKPLYPGEPSSRPYFGNHKDGDIWFGEKCFLQDVGNSGNQLRAALSAPVRLEFTPGADEFRLRGALQQAGYREILNPLEPLTRGCYRFVHQSAQVQMVEIFFKRNTYGWTMIGLSQDKKRLLCLACTGQPGQVGYTLEEAANVLLRAGAWNALVIDEGGDVFQQMIGPDGRLTNMVPSERRRLRATFIMARPKGPKGSDGLRRKRS